MLEIEQMEPMDVGNNENQSPKDTKSAKNQKKNIQIWSVLAQWIELNSLY